mgnify:CR=1 FL=1
MNERALWDIFGKHTKLPIYKLLGGRREKIKSYASTVMYETVDEYLKVIEDMKSQGFSAVKFHTWCVPNKDLEFMLVPDRSLFTLQKNGIEVTKNEYLAIKLHDGVFSDANKPYWFSNNPHSRMKTSIANILHTADFLASKVEYDIWKRNGGTTESKTKKSQSSTGKRVNSSPGLQNMLKKL